MEKYTWDDVIINPKLEKVKSYIGKEVYYANNPTECLRYANNNSKQFAKLNNINYEATMPFIVNVADFLTSESNFVCIIPKKEEYEYVPFKNSGEFIREFEDNTPIMHVYGVWIYEKIGKFDEKVPRLVTEMWGDGVIVGSDSHTTKWKDLLERFVFENNEPCGKLQEENND